MFAEAGATQAEINVARTRKRFHQDIRMDDCGSDLGPPEEASIRVVLAVEGCSGSAIVFLYECVCILQWQY